MKQQYTGYQTIPLQDVDWNALYNEHQLPDAQFLENEYLHIPATAGGKDAYFQYRGGEFHEVRYPVLNNKITGQFKPRNPEQYMAFDMLRDKQTTIKLITGTWGTGKTLALAVSALERVEAGEFDKLIWVRNNVQVKDTDPLGALPGDEFQKLLPYLGPLMDHVGGEEGIRMLIEQNKLEVIPLAYLRGRSIRNSIILSSEAENLTKQHIQLLMGRVDEGSNLWLDADLNQRDKDVFVKSAGIETMIDRLKGQPLFGYVHLVKSERSETARLADLLND